MQRNNSLNGLENKYETGNVYAFEFFNTGAGGQVFTMTKAECETGVERVLHRIKRNG